MTDKEIMARIQKGCILASVKIERGNFDQIKGILGNPSEDDIIFGEDGYFGGVVNEGCFLFDHPVEGHVGDMLVRFGNGHVCIKTEDEYKETVERLGKPLFDTINVTVRMEG